MNTEFSPADFRRCLKTEMWLFRSDFKDPKYGEKAKLLYKHYKMIIELSKHINTLKRSRKK